MNSILGPFVVKKVLLIACGLVIYSCDRMEKAIPVPPMPVVAVKPGQALTTTVLRFDCTESEPGNKGDKIYFRWDWNADGQWDTDFSAEPVFLHRFYARGTHQPVMEALNSSGLTDTCSLVIQVGQGYSKPKALFRLIPESGHRLTEFSFDATLTKDGIITRPSSPAPAEATPASLGAFPMGMEE